jgi:DNA-binding CsgD family transcriptional regulator
MVLLSPDGYTEQFELYLLCIGVAGVLPFGNNLTVNLPKAVRTVAHGGFWIRRAILSLYVRKTIPILQRVLMGDRRLTVRENEVANLVQKRASNQVIAHKLAISQRTAKFHISNILRKLNLSNRRELEHLNRLSASLDPELLLSNFVVVSEGHLPVMKRTRLCGDPSPALVTDKMRRERKSQNETVPPSAAAS